MAGAQVIVVGGGVIGLSVAYHLARMGADDVLLLERNRLSSGTSWHAAGIIGPLRATLNLTRVAMYAAELFGEHRAAIALERPPFDPNGTRSRDRR
ncbi:MAG: FAD-dependent oxidoreductase [Gammaproteobacteria bacterium]